MFSERVRDRRCQEKIEILKNIREPSRKEMRKRMSQEILINYEEVYRKTAEMRI